MSRSGSWTLISAAGQSPSQTDPALLARLRSSSNTPSFALRSNPGSNDDLASAAAPAASSSAYSHGLSVALASSPAVELSSVLTFGQPKSPAVNSSPNPLATNVVFSSNGSRDRDSSVTDSSASGFSGNSFNNSSSVADFSFGEHGFGAQQSPQSQLPTLSPALAAAMMLPAQPTAASSSELLPTAIFDKLAPSDPSKAVGHPTQSLLSSSERSASAATSAQAASVDEKQRADEKQSASENGCKSEQQQQNSSQRKSRSDRHASSSSHRHHARKPHSRAERLMELRTLFMAAYHATITKESGGQFQPSLNPQPHLPNGQQPFLARGASQQSAASQAAQQQGRLGGLLSTMKAATSPVFGARFETESKDDVSASVSGLDASSAGLPIAAAASPNLHATSSGGNRGSSGGSGSSSGNANGAAGFGVSNILAWIPGFA